MHHLSYIMLQFVCSKCDMHDRAVIVYNCVVMEFQDVHFGSVERAYLSTHLTEIDVLNDKVQHGNMTLNNYQV